MLHDKMVEWLYRHYLTRQNKQINHLTKTSIYHKCEKELTFLEYLAFQTMEDNWIMLGLHKFEKAERERERERERETKCTFVDHLSLQNIGILKWISNTPTSSRVPSDYDHFSVHSAFRKYFAARYIVTVPNSSISEKSIQFIQYQKYNQRFIQLFTFLSSLLQ